MYYDASSTDYISTPSFAIPNTGILTIETWMKSVLSTTTHQTIIGDGNQNNTVGFLRLFKLQSENRLYYYHANGTGVGTSTFTDFFLNLDNQ
jgi:hypothetical protein